MCSIGVRGFCHSSAFQDLVLRDVEREMVERLPPFDGFGGADERDPALAGFDRESVRLLVHDP
jgi:hypothetical protein